MKITDSTGLKSDIDTRSAIELFEELYHKVEWSLLTLKELIAFKKLNSEIINDYMAYRFNTILKGERYNPSEDLLLGRQKGFFIESVIGYLIINIYELYRIDKIKDTNDSVLYTKMIKLLRKENMDKKNDLEILNSIYSDFKDSVKQNKNLLERFELARNKIYSHHTNYNPKTIQTDYVRSSNGVSSTIKNETNISDKELESLLNPYVKFINSLLMFFPKCDKDIYTKINSLH